VWLLGPVRAEKGVRYGCAGGTRSRRAVRRSGGLLGDLLVQLDRVQYEANVKSAESRIKRLRTSIEVCRADLAKSKDDREQNMRLGTRGGVSRTDLILYQPRRWRIVTTRMNEDSRPHGLAFFSPI
jgi:hypothetical protein